MKNTGMSVRSCCNHSAQKVASGLTVIMALTQNRMKNGKRKKKQKRKPNVTKSRRQTMKTQNKNKN